MNSITTFDFSHQNPFWRFYEFSEQERVDNNLGGLESYLPIEEGNRDLGGFDQSSGIFRFGAKHNDIYPIIGDMIRWKIGLPPRKFAEQITIAEIVAPQVVEATGFTLYFFDKLS